jgi:hypothetical protein
VLVSGGARADDPIRDPEAHSAAAWPSDGRQDRDARPPEGSGPRPPGERPIAESIDGVVETFIREHTPCGLAGEGVPCFPTAIELEAPQYSVRESLRDLQGDGPSVPPTAPTHGEIIQAGANPRSAAGNVGGGADMGCKAKQLFRKITGRSRTYYVYRVWDSTGERGVLREQALDPDEFVSAPQFQFELVGRFGDECEALKAYRKVGHDARMRQAEPPPASRLEAVSPP